VKSLQFKYQLHDPPLTKLLYIAASEEGLPLPLAMYVEFYSDPYSIIITEDFTENCYILSRTVTIPCSSDSPAEICVSVLSLLSQSSIVRPNKTNLTKYFKIFCLLIATCWIMKDVSFRDFYLTLTTYPHMFEEEVLWAL
jgi:hypothetical protein